MKQTEPHKSSHPFAEVGRSYLPECSFSSVNGGKRSKNVANPLRTNEPTTPETFWQKVDKRGEDECWPWLGTLDGCGYGRVSFEGRKWSAHRLAMVFRMGPITEGLVVRHSCDNPPCCNPGHLVVGTQKQNMEDRNAKGRQAAHERNGRAKLTADIVRKVREAHTGLRGSLARLSREFGINVGIVRDIIRRKTWKGIEPIAKGATE